MQGTIDSQLNRLSQQIRSALGAIPGSEVADTLIQNQIAMSEFVLDSLASELAATGNQPAFAELDATLAQSILRLDELNALEDIGALGSNAGGTGST